MEFMLQEIESALKAQLYYFAILNSVMIPDVCAALPSADGESDSENTRLGTMTMLGKRSLGSAMWTAGSFVAAACTRGDSATRTCSTIGRYSCFLVRSF
jgi:hypothetical protein